MGTKADIAERKAANAVGKGGTGQSLPNRGTSTGLNGDTYGADISGDATNSMGGMKSGTKSNSVFESCPGEDC